MADLVFYRGLYSGQQIDSAVARALSGGALDQEIAALRSAVGSPLVATTAAQMTNTNKIYVYTGSEAGYIAGNWYYFNGSAWTSGGVYNAVAVDMAMSSVSDNAVANRVVTAALADALAEAKSAAYDAYPTESASGAIASTSVGADGIPLKSLKVIIVPAQSGEGDPSPTNVRPISGWTGAKIPVTGVNLFGGADMAAGLVAYVPGAAIGENNVVRFNRSATGDTDSPFCKLPYKENTQYTFVFTAAIEAYNSTAFMRINYTDGTSTDFNFLSSDELNTPKTFVVVSDAGKTVERVSNGRPGGSYYASLYCDESGVFEGVLTANDFVPYVGKTVAVTWQTKADTVYAGTLTYSGNGTWTLTATHAIHALDASTWTYISTRNYFGAGLPSDAIAPQVTSVAGWCSCYPVLTVMNNDTFYAQDKSLIYCKSGISGYKRMFIRDTDYDGDTLEQFTSSLAGQTLVYQLATPQTYTLTADDVLSMLGDCNVWADTGDVDAVFRCDPTLYIDSKIAALTALMSEI